ncbi:DEAD/DEAH box helicase [Gluconacetobacter entanii]|uniref:DEAD/DEAH box helicase n=1 Tax=Gluconacetobacter entanii TaxID=108528 RepID=UPI001C9354C1|nr:DEAD/DEAH box helicase [Gluconacetobacter entanii]MBY4640717.1 DEAD/DEAH box helicase [Gluconacetobacter entanii]MCW4581911.1 DEAD/DEAH box helicase [Gluconacetobacter entanii]MCW4585347.1 DEAD/DEAH box helicase [Gluconacetobacter entanii]MCW4588924.1 DEAD/DEAH box helicase [Gluconacetobacter entanii]
MTEDPCASFAETGLAAPVGDNLSRMGVRIPSPIQVQAIPPILAGRDVEGIAPTGTGKTVAFAAPLTQRLLDAPQDRTPHVARIVCLSPTRELANQTGGAWRGCARGTGLKVVVTIGGVPKARQVRDLEAGADILVATPGRLVDLLSDGAVVLDNTLALVVDEADRMLDLGFIDDMMAIAARLPVTHQTLLFSATMPDGIVDLGRKLLHKPVRVKVDVADAPPPRIRQQVMFVPPRHKLSALVSFLSTHPARRVLIFTQTRRQADDLAKALGRDMACGVMHGEHTQARRERTLRDFRDHRLQVLIATDVMARGIDVEDVTLVVNYDIPDQPESYVHRIGRTARAGRQGSALSLCAPEERLALKEIERVTGVRLKAIETPP